MAEMSGCIDTVGWVMQPLKIVPEVSGGTLNLAYLLTPSGMGFQRSCV